MYQRSTHAFLRAERHASHCRIQSTSGEFLREHWLATRSLLEAAHHAVLRMSKKGKRARNPSPRRLRRRVGRPKWPCYIQLIGHNPTRTAVLPPTHMQQAGGVSLFAVRSKHARMCLA